VIQGGGNILLDVGEVRYHAVFVERFALAVDFYNPVMAMQGLALAFVRKVQGMGRRYLESFANVIHSSKILAKIRNFIATPGRAA
jgi:hypothetical protein